MSGAIISHGAAIVANDMHHGPARAEHLVSRPAGDGGRVGGPALDVAGVTLLGAPNIVAGSKNRIAWCFTNSYVDTTDVIVLEPADGGATR